jgi:hypothetical protein
MCTPHLVLLGKLNQGIETEHLAGRGKHKILVEEILYSGHFMIEERRGDKLISLDW